MAAETSYFGRISAFFRALTDTKYAERRDLYVYIVGIQLLALILIIFGWSAFVNQKDIANGSTAAALTENNIPQQLLLFMLFQFMLIVADRIIYLYHSVKMKIGLQIAMCIFLQLAAFVIIPVTTGRTFGNNPIIIVWYFLMSLYLLASAYQIRFAYPKCILRLALTKAYGKTNYILFLIYAAIPFMYEVRTALDWACTDTTLKLLDWFKVGTSSIFDF